jgi:ribosomal protein L40E
MRGPLHVIRRRRAERPAIEVDAEQAATDAPTTAQPAADPGPAAASDVTSQTADVTSEAPPAIVPAGQEPVPGRPSFRHRGRLRRRLRYLRRVRELGFRDLGGLVFDQHRFSSVNEELVRGKLAALAAVDGELRALEQALDDRRPITELREPGVSVCARCGALHGSEARYCPSCGVPVRGALAIGEVGEAVSFPAAELGTAFGPAAAEGLPPGAAQPAPTAAEPATTAQPAVTAQPAAGAGVAPITAQPTQVFRPVAEPAARDQPRSDGVGGPPGDGARAAGDGVGAPPASGERPNDGVSAPPGDGAGAAGDGEAGRFVQPTGERFEP